MHLERNLSVLIYVFLESLLECWDLISLCSIYVPIWKTNFLVGHISDLQGFYESPWVSYSFGSSIQNMGMEWKGKP